MFLKRINHLGNTLLFRLTVLHTIAFTLLAIVSFMVFYYRIYSLTMERVDSDLLEEIEHHAVLLADSDLTGIQSRMAEESEFEDPAEEFYRLLDFTGKVLFTTDMRSWGAVDKKEVLANLAADGADPVFQTIVHPQQEFKARMVSAVVGPGTILQIGETLEEADEYLEIFRHLFSILIVILIIVSVFIGWYLARRALIDMEAVTLTAEEISNGSYDRRVNVTGQLKEIERLSTTFNKMLDRIQILLRSMKEINDNIAHDLRSPLARIRGIAEMTLVSEKPIEEYRDMAVSTMEECDSLIDMINTMLDITEAEAGVNGATDEQFDLTVLINEACELFRPVADEKKITLDCQFPESLLFRGVRKKMQRVVTNLLENAIKYTPEQGIVKISTAVREKEVEIAFEDNGIGISEKDLPHIFGRFYRCDRSRSQSGVGLGLSLAKAFAESMRGMILVSSTIDEGSTFTLKFAQ